LEINFARLTNTSQIYIYSVLCVTPSKNQLKWTGNENYLLCFVKQKVHLKDLIWYNLNLGLEVGIMVFNATFTDELDHIMLH